MRRWWLLGIGGLYKGVTITGQGGAGGEIIPRNESLSYDISQVSVAQDA